MRKVCTTLHLLLDIYKVVARTYQLGLQQLTKYLVEKQQRNQIFYCNRAIQEYTYNVTGNHFSFVNFINSPEHEVIAKAVANDADNLQISAATSG